VEPRAADTGQNITLSRQLLVIEYPDRGFAVEQHVPDDVRAAYRALVDAGFTSRLIAA